MTTKKVLTLKLVYVKRRYPLVSKPCDILDHILDKYLS